MKTNRKAGFTLIEIIIAMTLIAIFVTIPVFAYSSFTRSSRDTQRKNDINKIQGALEQYRANNGKYPPKETWLEDLVSGGYLPEIPTDPRNGQSVGDSSNLEYTYAYDVSDDGQTFELTSVLENPEAGGPGNPNEKSVYVVHPEGPKIAYTTPGIEGDPILPTTTGIAAPTIPFASRTPTPTRTPTPAAATPTPPAGCQYVAEACTNSIPPNCTYKLVCTTETPTPMPGTVIMTYTNIPGSSNVIDVAGDLQGNIWWLSDANVGKLNIATGQMTAVDSQYPVGFSWVESKLITGPDNNIWFVSPAYSKVGRINTAAGTVSYFDLPIIGNPQIAAGSDGNIYVTGVVSYWDMKLWKISTAGTVLNTYTIPVNPFPRGLASDPSGALYFPVIGDGLYRLSFTGTETKVASFTEDFRTIAYNGGAFWVAEWGNSDPLSDIAKITTAGTVTNYVNGHPSNEHYAMMDAQVGPDGNVWFSGNKLVRMKPDGTITEFSFGSLAGGLGLGSDGKLYLGNAWNAILKIQPGN